MQQRQLVIAILAGWMLAAPGAAFSAPPDGASPAGGEKTAAKQGEIRAEGQVRSTDPAKGMLNITHGPIPALGWPAMTMDFTVAPGVDLKGLRPGLKVLFTLKTTPDGGYRIVKITPLP